MRASILLRVLLGFVLVLNGIGTAAVSMALVHATSLHNIDALEVAADPPCHEAAATPVRSHGMDDVADGAHSPASDTDCCVGDGCGCACLQSLIASRAHPLRIHARHQSEPPALRVAQHRPPALRHPLRPPIG